MPNRLSAESSPYLLQHAANPVDWWPWSDEALAFARQTDRPIFLSIGYAACHWCHVMAHESFEDPSIAELLNREFVPIKVDREERPDLDAIYMQAVVAMSGQGGWPLSAFLTPAGEPFFAGTYFPPARRHQLPAFREVLEAIRVAWQTDRDRLQTTARRVLEHVGQAAAPESGESRLNPDLLRLATRRLFDSYDWTHGGWGGAPKFPQAPALDLLLNLHLRFGERLPLDMAIDCLRHMAHGGIYDQLGGGFHRYAVDAAWQVPHFEKMLYDNALLARTYLHAYQLTRDEELLRTGRGTLDYLLRDMADPYGGFYSSEDADSEGEEGRFYLWSAREIRDVLKPSGLAEIAEAAFGVTEAGNFEGRNILHLPFSATELANRLGLDPAALAPHLRESVQLLVEKRSLRVRPTRDEKVLTDWNGLLLSALADAARALGEPIYLSAAQKLADFLLSISAEGEQLQHSWREGQAKVPAFLKDFAALGSGLLTLYQADFDDRWFVAAARCADFILDHFEDSAGGFFDVRAGGHGLPFRPMDLQDSPTPSAGALATDLLLRLSALTGEPRYERSAERAILRIQPLVEAHPTAFASWSAALDFACGPRGQLALLGQRDSLDFRRLVDVAAEQFRPELVTAGGAGDAEHGPALLRGRAAQGGRAMAYLCRSFRCELPTNDPFILRAQLEGLRQAPAPADAD
jgi:hypothetical protein